MMLYPTGFLTHYSYHKLKKKMFCSFNCITILIPGLISQIQTNLQFVFQLNCMPFSPYSASICVSVYAKKKKKNSFFEKEKNY